MHTNTIKADRCSQGCKPPACYAPGVCKVFADPLADCPAAILAGWTAVGLGMARDAAKRNAGALAGCPASKGGAQ